jgi:hypothetical protein
MRFDEETWDIIYEIPVELSPVIEELTNQNNSLKEAVAKLRAYRAELIPRGQQELLASEYVRVVVDTLGAILRPLDDRVGGAL